MKNNILIAILLCLSFTAFSQSASIKETTMTFRTYGYGDPNPVAKPGKIYPYYRFDGYTNAPVDKEWKIIVMENEWIKVLIAPEIGGKILGAIEKSTRNEFLYFNKVVKFRDVAMRGPWTSGGIEYNFGSIGHAPTCSSPVDYLTMENPDGSVSCFIGDMDLSSRTEWRVEVRLPADKAWFETHASWYNPSDFSTSKYHWMNAAADATDDLTYYWPGKSYIGHAGNVHNWPIMADGRDISRYAQNDYGNYHSYHVLGEVADYFGGYYKTKDFGFGHLTDYAIKPGKKIWIWGLSRQGEIWVDLLTDPDLGNKQYTEIQTGLLFNQAATGSTKTPYKHQEFKSKESERFTEYWFPVKNTKGISDVNEYGVLNVQNSISKNHIFDVWFCALQEVHDSLLVTINDSLNYSFKVDLKPMETFKSSVTRSPRHQNTQAFTPDKRISFKVYTQPFKHRYSDRPVQSPSFNWTSLQGKYITALEDSRQRHYEKALKGYYACLEEDQNYLPALVGAAQELMRINTYNNAQNLLMRALSIDTYNPQANYLLGIVKKKNGEYYRAIEAFGLSTRSMEYRSAAFAQLSEVSILMKNFQKALHYAESSLDYNRFNISAIQSSILALRNMNNHTEALHTLDVLLEMDPLNHMARFENYLLLPDETNMEVFQSNIKTEMPEQVYLELALYYHNIGFDTDALTLLAMAPDNVLIEYLKSYLSNSKPNVRKLNIELIFPFRQEMYEVFEWAESVMPHWKNRYYMGLMKWNYRQLNEARKLFRSCGDEPESPAFYLARTKLFTGVDTELVVHDLERALKLNPDNWRSYKYIVDFYMKHGAYPLALEFARKGTRHIPDNFILQVDLAKAELYNKNYKKCLKILDELVILPAEGAQEGHNLYRQAHLLQAVEEYKNGSSKRALEHISKAREWPENLGVGKPYITDERIENYLLGLILMSGKQDAMAAEAFSKVLEYTEQNKPSPGSPYLLLAYSLQFLGQEDQAVQVLSDWMKAKPKDPVVHWATAMYANNTERAERALSNYKNQTGGTPWNPGGSDTQFRLVYEIVNQIRLK